MLKSVSQRTLQRIETRLHYLYGDRAHALLNRLFMMVGRYGVGLNGFSPTRPAGWSERDIVLISYGDMLSAEGEPPLRTLQRWMAEALKDAISSVHILPFFPYSSDDGFSVMDYRSVDPALGSWADIDGFQKHFELMFDLVINHVSRQSAWFRDYVNGIAPYRDYFHEVDPATDISAVVRPRSLPLLSETPTRSGVRHLWTTFSEDQVDVNFANPEVLFEYLDILFGYISRGASIIRLDAIAYLWKTPGTSCIHLTQTHEIVKLLRDIVDMVAPHVRLITETNVPHEENISYFGNGDEAHMVYQFSLPPLLAHGLLTGSAARLREWAQGLTLPGPQQTYFNFTASHDGVGVRPLQGFLSESELTALLGHVRQMGGRVSFKRNSDGTDSPYELNITYFDLLGERLDTVTSGHIERYISSQAIMLCMRGIPAVYFNSLLGARNHIKGVASTGQNRTINREKWGKEQLERMLSDDEHHHGTVFKRYLRLLKTRRARAAFHPDGAQQILTLDDTCFAVERIAPDQSDAVTCLTNFSNREVKVSIDDRFPALSQSDTWRDVITGRKHGSRKREIQLSPWRTVWLANG